MTRWFEPDAFQKAYEETQHDDSRDAFAFRESVSTLKASPPDAALAQTIYDEYVSEGATLGVELSSQTRTDLIQLFESHPAPGEKDFFDDAYASITGMLQDDTYKRFEAGGHGYPPSTGGRWRARACGQPSREFESGTTAASARPGDRQRME